MVHLMNITETRLLVQEIKTVTFHSKVCVLYGRVRNGNMPTHALHWIFTT